LERESLAARFSARSPIRTRVAIVNRLPPSAECWCSATNAPFDPRSRSCITWKVLWCRARRVVSCRGTWLPTVGAGGHARASSTSADDLRAARSRAGLLRTSPVSSSARSLDRGDPPAAGRRLLRFRRRLLYAAAFQIAPLEVRENWREILVPALAHCGDAVRGRGNAASASSFVAALSAFRPRRYWH
jgi:hypothetical protein